MKKFTFVLILLTTLNLIWAQSYEYDKSFGDEGIVKVQCNGTFCLGYKIQLLDDNSFLLYTVYQDEESEDEGFEILKFDNSGQIEKSFGDNGVFSVNNAHTDFPLYHGLLPDRKIAVIDLAENTDNIRIRILDESGKIEKTLGLDVFPETSTIPVKCLFKNGYLYIGGINFQYEALFILKTDLNGKLDSTFAENGIFLLGHETNTLEFMDMEFQNSDLIIYSTFVNTNWKSNDQIFRIKENGTFDIDFGTMGYFKNEYTDGFGDLSVDSKNRIVITPFYNDVAVYRLNENGLPDINFGNGGRVDLSEISLLGNYFFHSINSKDEILLYGSISNDDYDSFGIPVITKINETGKKDNNFGSSGILFNNIDKLAVNYSGEIDANGNIITTGAFMDNLNSESFSMFLTRLKPKTSAENNILVGNDFTISPNPVYSNQLNFTFPTKNNDKMLIEVIDILGKNVLKTEISELKNDNNEISIDFPNNIKNGQYLVVVNDGKEIITKKIIVNR